MATAVSGKTNPADKISSPVPRVGDDGFANLAEAGTYLKISRAKLYGLMDAGELPYAKLGRCRRIPWRALRALAERSMVVG